MKLTVGRIVTKITGGFTELEFLKRNLAIENEKKEPISLVEDFHGNQVFYSGLLSRAEQLLAENQVEYEIVHEVEDPQVTLPSAEEIATCLPGITLREHQVKAIQKALLNKRGIVDIATGGGKTEVQLAIAKIVGGKSLILVTGLKAMVGTIRRAEKYGLSAGPFSGDERDLSKQITVAVDDSLWNAVKRPSTEFRKFAKRDCTALQIDECHHTPSATWSKSAAYIEAPYRLGFSGSPFASQGELEYSDAQLIGLTGEVLCQVPAWYLIELGLLAKPIVTMVDIRFPKLFSGNTSWFYCYPRGIVKNTYRNEVAMDLATQLRDQGSKVLVLVHQVNHGYLLLDLLRDGRVKFSCGGDEVALWTGDPADEAVWGCPRDCKKKAREKRHTCEREIYPGIRVGKETSFATLDELLEMRAGIFIGSSVYNESVDIPDVTDLIVLSGMKKYRQVVQKIGRALRPKPGENIVRIFDFLDKTHNILWKHSNQRIEVYQHDDYRYQVNFTLDMVNNHLAQPLRITADPLKGWRKRED